MRPTCPIIDFIANRLHMHRDIHRRKTTYAHRLYMHRDVHRRKTTYTHRLYIHIDRHTDIGMQKTKQ